MSTMLTITSFGKILRAMENLAVLLWYLDGLFLSCSYTSANPYEEVKFTERGTIHLNRPGEMVFLDLKKYHFIAVLNVDLTSILILNSSVLEDFRSILLDDSLHNVKVPFVSPEGIFPFPAIVISHGGSVIGGQIRVVNFTDFNRPRDFSLTGTVGVNESIDYNNPHWVDGNAFIASRVTRDGAIERARELMYFKRADENVRIPWEATKIRNAEAKKMIWIKNLWNDFQVIYVIASARQLFIWWTESTRDAAGIWSNAEQFKEQMLMSDSVSDFLLVDLNMDGKLDLLLCIASGGMLKAYEIPYSADFRKPEKYVEHLLIRDLEQRSFDRLCHYVLKSFTPFDNYEGKPWIAFSAEFCTQASILVPGDKDWQYTRHVIPVGDNDVVTGLEVVDMDRDGLADLFISVSEANNIKALSLVKSNVTRKKTVQPKGPSNRPVGTDFSDGSSLRFSRCYSIIFVLMLVCTSDI